MIARNPGVPMHETALAVPKPVDLEAPGGAAIQLSLVPVKHDLVGPIPADDVAVRLRAEDARIGHQEDGVGRGVRAVPAEEFEPGRRAEGQRAAEEEPDRVAQLNPRPIAQ